MPYLILTRAGYDALLARPGAIAAGTALHINPSLLATAELQTLRQAGVLVHVLDAPVAAAGLTLPAQIAGQLAGEIVEPLAAQREHAPAAPDNATDAGSDILWVEMTADPAPAPDSVAAVATATSTTRSMSATTATATTTAPTNTISAAPATASAHGAQAERANAAHPDFSTATAALAHPASESAPGAILPPAPLAAPSPSPSPSPRPGRPRRPFAATVGLLAGVARQVAAHGMAPREFMVLPYLGYGNAHTLWLRGRVLRERAFGQQQAHDSRWRNMAALYRRLESDEVAGATVHATFEGRSYSATTDAGGYFDFAITPASAPQPGWLHLDLALAGTPVRAQAQVLVPDAGARFGVISDIDDTVLWTNVTNKLNMALMLAGSNPSTRQPFKGVAAFYRALHAGRSLPPAGNALAADAAAMPSSPASNPLFYVSSSPWHLFGHLVDFLRLQGLPQGPLMLRELGLRQLFKLGQHGSHKLGKIAHILASYPGLQFVLIGDSGEQDPEIYAELVRTHPGRVRVIYIRNVNPDPARVAALDRLIDQLADTGTDLIVAADSAAAAAHAAAAGLIDVARLAEIRADLRTDGAARSSLVPLAQ